MCNKAYSPTQVNKSRIKKFLKRFKGTWSTNPFAIRFSNISVFSSQKVGKICHGDFTSAREKPHIGMRSTSWVEDEFIEPLLLLISPAIKSKPTSASHRNTSTEEWNTEVGNLFRSTKFSGTSLSWTNTVNNLYNTEIRFDSTFPPQQIKKYLYESG